MQLLGALKHSELEKIYNGSDYFILGSYYEGSGYALCEAMACGCVPIVTKIPSFIRMTDNGDCAYLFSPGNSNDLLHILTHLKEEELINKRKKAVEKFERDLSFKAIARTLISIIRS